MVVHTPGEEVVPPSAWRPEALSRLDGQSFDVLIVGGGINGAVSAAVLAGRGAKVALVDGGDFGGFTSQASSNLVWGGFKYLENYEFGLVRDLCTSRNRLIKAYPDNVQPIGFLASLDNDAPYRPSFAMLGAIAYWGIGGFKTRRPRLMRPRTIKEREPVVDTTNVRGGVEYFDAYLKDNDSRFVFNFIRSAVDVGAVALNYLEVVGARRTNERWQVELANRDGGGRVACDASAIINAAGPMAPDLNDLLGVVAEHTLVFSKGIHLVVPRLTSSERVLAFFDDTQRLFYVIPMGRRSVIGTTDTRVDNPHTEVTEQDRTFLLEQINERLDLPTPLTPSDIIAERCGVRPLVVPAGELVGVDADWTALSRRHVVESDAGRHVVTVFGGKLTDCLNVGEEVAQAVTHLGIALEPDGHDWYGEPSRSLRAEFFRRAKLSHLDQVRNRPDVEPVSQRLWRRYGSRALEMLDAIALDPSMADDIIEHADYLRVELYFAARTELITKLEDFLRRRSKITQVIPSDEIRDADGLEEAAGILFGRDAPDRLREYFG